MNERSKQAAQHRDDVSRFVVHLTRDNRKGNKNGGTASENFLSIFKQKKIIARNPHCLHMKEVLRLPAKQQKQFHVACFTETPLNQIRHIVGEIPGRGIELEPYGFVFTKEFMIRHGAQPAIYINCHGTGYPLRNAADGLFHREKETNFEYLTSYLLPYMNAMSEKYDFTWEREWRVQGTLEFRLSDLVCVVLPPDGEENLRNRLARLGIPAISPEWSYERIIAEFAVQQRNTKEINRELIEEMMAEEPPKKTKDPK